MVDALGGFVAGHQAGANAYKKREAVRKKAEFEMQKRKEDYALKVITTQDTLTKSSEASWGRIQGMIDREDYAPEMANDVLKMAMSHDATHGGPRALSYFKSQLNVEGPSQGPTETGEVISGVPRPKDEGFKSNLQRLEHEAKISKLQTSAFAGKVKGQAMDYLEQNAFTDGILDPSKAGLALINYEAQLTAQPGIDQDVIQPIIDNLEKDIANHLQDQAGAQGEIDEFNDYVNGVSTKMSKHIRDIFAAEFGINDEIVKMIDGSAGIVAQMDEVAQRKSSLGWNLPQIKMHLRKQFINSDGTWPGGVDATPYDIAMSQVTPQFQSKVAEFYSQGTDPSEWEPVFDPKVGDGYMVSNISGDIIPIFGGTTINETATDEAKGQPVGFRADTMIKELESKAKQ